MATEQSEVYERARLARDARFDGQFFIGVKTTGIYCRPICPANPPRRENVSFFPTAAAAGEAGYRPCLRCRPETAPGTPAWAGTSATVRRGLRLISSGALDEDNIESLSARLGVSSRHLRRLFRKHLGASPQAVAHTQRLHFAKRLIDETRLPMNHIALAAGYGSVRRFNDAFQNSYGRAPRDLRKLREGPESADPSSPMTVRLPYRNPFNWTALLAFLGPRATPGVEIVEGQTYRRSIRIEGAPGILEAAPDPEAGFVVLTLRGVATDALFQAVQRAREMFDLDAPVNDIARVLRADAALAARLKQAQGIRVPGAWDGFELTVRTILGQQVSVAGATTLAARIAERYGDPLPTAVRTTAGGLNRLFPSPQRLARARIADLGLVSSRAEAVRALAGAVVDGEITFDFAQDPEEFVRKLTSIKGIGDWTAQYVSMRVMKNPDAFPETDLGLLKAIAAPNRVTPAQLSSRAEDWRPWRAYAAMLLWQTAAPSGG